jgi:hypothetical protein
VASAFAAWAEFTEERSAHRALLRRAVEKFASMTSAAAYGTWREYVRENRSDRKRTRRAAVHFTSKALALGLEAFVRNLEHA